MPSVIRSLPVWVTVVTIAGLALGFSLPTTRIDFFAFYPAIGWRNDWWRWLTASLVHLNTWHLLANLAGLLVCGWVAAARGINWAFPLMLIAIALSVLLGLGWGFPGVEWYVGLSGALYGVFAWLALEYVICPTQLGQRGVGLLLLVGGLVKVGWDMHQPATTVGWLHIVPIPAAHLCGYAAGIGLGLLVYSWRRGR
ncbi:rhombosortase [Chitinivorax sp. B]|uniref:rhombosortase n=1 Tax=Chitinivorax sp. B TaxID=2502235 RepID=UPI0010F79E39|nr:rhombosortase [Chitinivorax sp. B]